LHYQIFYFNVPSAIDSFSQIPLIWKTFFFYFKKILQPNIYHRDCSFPVYFTNIFERISFLWTRKHTLSILTSVQSIKFLFLLSFLKLFEKSIKFMNWL
jgi:hypothetical protein